MNQRFIELNVVKDYINGKDVTESILIGINHISMIKPAKNKQTDIYTNDQGSPSVTVTQSYQEVKDLLGI